MTKRKPDRITKGGSYVRGKDGKPERREFTAPAPDRAPEAATPTEPAPPTEGRAADRRPADVSAAPAQGQPAKRAERPVSERKDT